MARFRLPGRFWRLTGHTRFEDVEEDIDLPPIERSTILLDLSPQAAKTYNAILSLVAVNAIDSERSDVVGALNVLACFTWLMDSTTGLYVPSTKQEAPEHPH